MQESSSSTTQRTEVATATTAAAAMSTSSPSSLLLSSLQDLLASVIRVRNRLAQTPEERLYHVLTGLLPRLLRKLDENSLALYRRQDEDDNNASEYYTRQEKRCRQELQSQLVGTISHAMERIRGTCSSTGVSPTPPAASYLESLLPLLETLESNVGRTILLRLFQTSLPRCSTSIPPCAIPALIQCVNRIYGEILHLQQQKRSNASHMHAVEQHEQQPPPPPPPQPPQIEQLQPDENENAVSETFKSHFRMAGWLLLDAIAIQSGLGVVQDPDMVAGGLFNDNVGSSSKNRSSSNNWDHLGMEPATQGAVQAATSALHGGCGAGTLDLFLDILLFWPFVPPGSNDPFAHRRRLQDGGGTDFDNSTGISMQGMKRMNHPCSTLTSTASTNAPRNLGVRDEPAAAEAARMPRHHQGMPRWPVRRIEAPASPLWNEVHMRQLKYVVLRYAIWPSGKGLFQTEPATSTSTSTTVSDDRALLLTVLFASPNSMHGRLALSILNPVLGAARLHRVGNEWRQQKLQQTQQPKSTTCSASLACSILILILGDAAAQPVLDKYKHTDADDNSSWKYILGPRPTLPQFRRPPLPLHVAARGMDFVRQHFRPNIGNAAAAAAASHNDFCGIRLFVDLALAIQHPRRHGAYWGIQLIEPLYKQNQKLQEQTAATGNDGKDAGDNFWTSEFHRQCLLTARAVLSMVPEAAVLQLDPRQERPQRPGEELDMHEGGEHPFGPRGDLNRLLVNHRVSRKKRRLQSEGALQARQTAYQIITELCRSSNSFGAEPKESGQNTVGQFELPALIFQCAASEEESLQPYVARALEALLQVHKKLAIRNNKHCDRDDATDSETNSSVTRRHSLALVAPLLPSLICAASADSTVSRLAVARWCSEFLVCHDPHAALHICSYIADDPDTYVSGVAKKAVPILKMVGTSSSSSSSSALAGLPVKLLNTNEPLDVMEIRHDLQQRVQYLATTRLPHMSDCAQCSTVSQLLLQDFRYSVESVEEALELDYEGTLDNVGISRHNPDASDMKAEVLEFTCGICYDETRREDGFALSCSHCYCLSCWQSYLASILDGGTHSNSVATAKCPENNCGERLVARHVQEIHADLIPQWQSALLEHFLDLDESYRMCPGPDCQMVAHISSPTSQGVSCTQCHTCFCFQCGNAPHKPAKCSDFVAWNEIYGSSDFWVKKHAKPCPSCGVPIEKNNGCNHMKCTRCSTDFCWLCLSPLHLHLEAHTCNRFDPTTIADNDEERRALFFTDRYQAHDDAEMFTKERLKTLDQSLAKLAERFRFVTDDQLEIMSEAVETLALARRFLKYSYIAAWAKRHQGQDRKIQDQEQQACAFESHQATLELVTERLSNMTVAKLDDLYDGQGERGVRRFFAAMSFHTSSIARYMARLQLLEEEEGGAKLNRDRMDVIV